MTFDLPKPVYWAFLWMRGWLCLIVAAATRFSKFEINGNRLNSYSTFSDQKNRRTNFHAWFPFGPSGMRLQILIWIVAVSSVFPNVWLYGEESVGGSIAIDYKKEQILDENSNLVDRITILEIHKNFSLGKSVCDVSASTSAGLGFWEDTSTWGSVELSLARSYVLTSFLVDAAGIRHPGELIEVAGEANVAAEAILQGGPTNRTIELPFKIKLSAPGLSIDLTCTREVSYNVTIPSGANIYQSQGAQIASLQIDAGGNLESAAPLLVDSKMTNYGTFGQSGSGYLRAPVSISSYGDLYLSGSTMETDGPMIINGGIGISGVCSLFGDSLSGSTSMSILSGSGLNMSGPIGLSIPMKVDLSNTIHCDGFISGNWTNTGRLVVSGGGLKGTLMNAVGATVEFANNVERVQFGQWGESTNAELYDTTGLDLINAGTVIWNGSQELYSGQCVNERTVRITNLANGLFDIQGDAVLRQHARINWVITNAGTFRKSGGTGTTTLGLINAANYGGGLSFTNTGTVEVLSGTLAILGAFNNDGTAQVNGGAMQINGGGESAGVFSVGSTGLLDFASGNFSFKSGMELNTVPGAHVTYSSGGYTFEAGTNSPGAGTLDVTGGVAINGPAGWRQINLVPGGAISGNWTNTGRLVVSGGGLKGTLMNAVGATVEFANNVERVQFGQWGESTNAELYDTTGLDLINAGTVIWNGSQELYSGQCVNERTVRITNLANGLFDIQGDAVLRQHARINWVITNAGTFRKSGGTGTTTLGLINAANYGGGLSFTNTGTVEVLSGTLAILGAFEQITGITALAGGFFQVDRGLILNGGTLSGVGTILGNVINNGGLVYPGGALAGTLTINGNYTQRADGSLAIQIGGVNPSADYDQLVVTGIANVDGILVIDQLSGFSVLPGNIFNALTYSSRTGSFSTVAGTLNGVLVPNYETGQLTLSYANAIAPSFSAQPTNQSVLAGNSVSISCSVAGSPTPSIQWQRSLDSGATWGDLINDSTFSGVNSNSLTIIGVPMSLDGQKFRAAATNGVNPTATSNAVMLTVTKATPTIGWPAPAALVYGQALGDIQLNAAVTGVSGAFTYSPASGTVLDAGTQRLNVTFTPIDSANFAAATQSVDLIVNKAPLTAMADDKVKFLGTVNPSLTISYAGFVNGDTAAAIDTLPTIGTTADTGSPAGSYPITLSGGTDNNYALTLQNGTLTVTDKTLQIITFAAPTGKTYGATPVTLSASATSGLPVTFAMVSGPAMLSGSTLMLTGAGDVTVRASQAGDATYATAPNVDRTFTVSKAALTVTADGKSRAYGANNPVFTASYSGFVNGDSASVVTGAPSLSTAATIASNAGAYTITPGIGTLAASNYLFTTFTPGTLTVTKIPLTVSADNKSKVQGSANPTLTVNYSGFVNGDTASSLTTQPTATTTAVLSSPVGSYPITPAGGVSTNYSFSYLPGTLSVNSPGAPTFTTQPVSQSITVGNSATFTAAASGSPSYQWQKNNVNISGATNSSYTVSNAAAANAGNYAVIATNVSGSVTSNIATLTVNKIVGTVTLANLLATYDGLTHVAAIAGTTPVGLMVDLTYDGSATAPTNAGSYAVVATINDPTYTGTTSGTLSIAKANPVIVWATPAPITNPTALSAAQLNATANVAGTFVYSPSSGTVLAAGDHTLTATFTPADQTNYANTGVAQRTLTVQPGSGGVIPIGFGVQGYLTRYPEVAAIYGTDWYGAWIYYRDYGIYQGQVYDELFRVEEYLALYPELFAIFGNDLSGALMHWLTQGSIEGKLGRIPLEFKAQGYFDRNPDVAAAVGNNPILAWGHYWLYGIYEGRAYDDELRVFEYLAINADLTAAFVDDWRTAALHWMRYGRTEGRLGRIPLIFSATEYLNRNPDVAATWGTNPTTDFLHFWLYGINEGRTFDDLFRVDEYLALNPDLAGVFGSDRRGAFKHWVRYGQSEGRKGRYP